jgi:transposase IS116/IS110/IS902 family protein
MTAGQAARILGSVTPPDRVAAARCELAADYIEDLRRIDARQRDARRNPDAAVRASGTSLTGLSGVGAVVAATVIGEVRDVSRFPGRDRFAAYNGTAPIEVSSGNRKGLPAEQAREPADQPRHPHDRGDPDPPVPQPGPRLLRQETGRGQDPGASRHILSGPGVHRGSGQPLFFVLQVMRKVLTYRPPHIRCLRHYGWCPRHEAYPATAIGLLPAVIPR